MTTLPHSRIAPRHHLLALTLFFFTMLSVLLRPLPALAQANSTAATAQSTPMFWYVLAAAAAMLVPAGLLLLATANLDAERAWRTALAGIAAIGLAAFAYWAFGFALQFGGIGLVYPQAGLRGLVWEWSPLSSEWGIGWGMAGLSGWFLSGSDVTALAYALFLGHLPWVMTATALPLMALRGRAPTVATLILALAIGGFLFPIAGNWVQGGGLPAALGRNLTLGHGFVDYGGAGTVHLVAAGFGLAALTVWGRRESNRRVGEQALPRTHQPILSVVGALLVLGGVIGWLWANPLQVDALGDLPILRGSVNILLAASAGAIIPLLYTWFVAGSSHAPLTGRGGAGGMGGGVGCGAVVGPGGGFFFGCFAGATVPFVTYLLDGRLLVDDATGIVVSSGIPAIIGLLCVGLFADGVAGAGWQMTGLESYRGVTGQGVSALFVASGFQVDFPGQIQAQVIGITALALWGFLCGLILCAPLGLIFHGLLRRQDAPSPATVVTPVTQLPPTSLPGRQPVSSTSPLFLRREGDMGAQSMRPPEEPPRA